MEKQEFINKVDQYLIDPENIKKQAAINAKLNRQVDYYYSWSKKQ